MRPEGVAAAQRELKRAERCIARFTRAESIDDAEDAWVDFLAHANKVYTKLRGACHGEGVDWMWWKKQMDERRDDPLLLYVHHARNTDTHRLEEIVIRVDGEDEYAIMPLPVTDAGIRYDVPTNHKGHELTDLDVLAIMWIAGGHLYDLVEEAASRLR